MSPFRVPHRAGLGFADPIVGGGVEQRRPVVEVVGRGIARSSSTDPLDIADHWDRSGVLLHHRPTPAEHHRHRAPSARGPPRPGERASTRRRIRSPIPPRLQPTCPMQSRGGAARSRPPPRLGPTGAVPTTRTRRERRRPTPRHRSLTAHRRQRRATRCHPNSTLPRPGVQPPEEHRFTDQEGEHGQRVERSPHCQVQAGDACHGRCRHVDESRGRAAPPGASHDEGPDGSDDQHHTRANRHLIQRQQAKASRGQKRRLGRIQQREQSTRGGAAPPTSQRSAPPR